jgi:hypothetical protein
MVGFAAAACAAMPALFAESLRLPFDIAAAEAAGPTHRDAVLIRPGEWLKR